MKEQEIEKLILLLDNLEFIRLESSYLLDDDYYLDCKDGRYIIYNINSHLFNFRFVKNNIVLYRNVSDTIKFIKNEFKVPLRKHKINKILI